MNIYLISFVTEDPTGFGFAYRIIEQKEKITERNLKYIAKDLKKHEKTDRVIILNILNLTKGV